VPVSPRKARVACSISLILLLANCGDNPTGLAGKPGIRAVAGAGITDTVDAAPLQALVVEVRDQNGALASGVVVRFEPKLADETQPYYSEPTVRVCPLSAQNCAAFYGLVTDTTDARGRAKVTVQMGRVIGPGVVRLTVPEFGLADSATYTITAGAPAAVRVVGGDTTLDIGGTATLSGSVVDRYENPRTETTTLSAGPGSAIALNAATGTVTAREMGTQWVLVRYNALVDSASVRVVPPGRLLVWSSSEQAVRLVNINGSAERTIVTSVASDYGAFPQFDATRQRITLHAGSQSYGGPSNALIVIDTTGASRRDIIGFSSIMVTRYLADGTIMVVGLSSTDNSHPGYSLWRVATDNTITFVAALPGFGGTYGGADVSHDGTRVAYLATSSSPSELRLLDVASGSTTVLDFNANSPRWSAQDDRIVYLSTPGGYYNSDGVATVINTNGSGRKVLNNFIFSPGMSWSPDGVYVVGRATDYSGFRVVRVSDGAAVSLQFPTTSGCCHDYYQPDWR
jgi:hypothetical protein